MCAFVVLDKGGCLLMLLVHHSSKTMAHWTNTRQGEDRTRLSRLNLVSFLFSNLWFLQRDAFVVLSIYAGLLAFWKLCTTYLSSRFPEIELCQFLPKAFEKPADSKQAEGWNCVTACAVEPFLCKLCNGRKMRILRKHTCAAESVQLSAGVCM